MAKLLSLDIGPLENLEEQISRPGPDSDYWYEPYGLASARDALAIAAVSSGIRYISETLASMPCHVFERTGTGREFAREHSAYYLVHDQPNRYQTALEFYEQVVRDVIIHGAHISRLIMNAHREVLEMEPLEWSRCSIIRDRQTGLRVFRYTKPSGEPEFLFDDQVLFIYGRGSSPWHVQSILDLHAETLGISTTARRYLSRHLSKGGIGPVYVHFKQMLNPEVKKTWVEWFQKNWLGAKNAGSIPILDGDSELKSIRAEHDKMQFAELQQFYVGEVARIIGVPPHKIQDLTRSTNNNIEEQSGEAVSDCLRPWAKRIESRLNVSIFGAREMDRFYCEFDLDGLLRGNSQAQAVLMAAEIQNGVRKPDEWRKLRNLNQVGGAADKLYIQGATVPLELAGQQNQQQPAAQEAASK